MKFHTPGHLSVVTFEKGAFGSSSTLVANFTYDHNSLQKYGNIYLSEIDSVKNQNYLWSLPRDLKLSVRFRISCLKFSERSKARQPPTIGEDSSRALGSVKCFFSAASSTPSLTWNGSSVISQNRRNQISVVQFKHFSYLVGPCTKKKITKYL